MTDLGMARKMVKRWVPQPTAKVSNECLGRCVSDVFFYDSGIKPPGRKIGMDGEMACDGTDEECIGSTLFP